MTDRPILFSPSMALAAWEGWKTQTRRVLLDGKAPAYYAGDRLWVRERWCVSRQHDKTSPSEIRPRVCTVMYEAGGSMTGIMPMPKEDPRPPAEYAFAELSRMPDWAGRMRQGIHMPRWASRMTLIVTEVRIQRISEITEEDIKAEGIRMENVIIGATGAGGYHREITADRYFVPGAEDEDGHEDADAAFAKLWNGINEKRGFGLDADPVVAAYTFTRRKANIDAL